MKKWEISRIREARKDEIAALSAALKISPLTAALLTERGCETAEKAQAFLSKQQEAFYDPFLMKDMEKAVTAIERALEEKRRIFIYGDYDVDGVTSVSALYLYLQSLGAEVDYYIPSRAVEGYGVNQTAIDGLMEKGAQLVITVDTGITAAAEIEYAAQKGLDFIVTDHHACHTKLPQALAVVNPHRPDCPYPFKDLAGVGVVFKLLCALEKSACLKKGESGAGYLKKICREYADLAAVGTVADVMPIVEENRLIVSLGLQTLANTPRLGLKALMQKAAAGAKPYKVNTAFIGFTLAPRINAAGRLGSAERAVELILSEQPQQAEQIAQELCAVNLERQQEETAIAEQAVEKIAKEVDLNRDEAIVLASDHWHQGVIGIVASRLTEKYGLPTILISFEGETGKGSGRSISGVNLVQALSGCEDLLLKFGGHALAAGLSIEKEKLPAFKDRLNQVIREKKDETCEDVLFIDCAAAPEELTVLNAEELSLLEPFGSGNPEPLLILEGAKIAEAKQIGGGKHTKLILEKDGIRCEGVYFGLNLLQTNFYAGDEVDAVFNLSVNDYMNIKTAQLILRDMRLTGVSAAYLEQGRRLYEAIKEGRKVAKAEEIIPNREDFAAVYKYIKNEVRRSNDIIGVKGIERRLCGMNYVKIRYIIEIFREMNLIGIENYGIEPDIYKFKLKVMQTKVNLEKSSIYKRLKSRKEYH